MTSILNRGGEKAVFYDVSFMFYYFASDILGKLMFVYLC